MTMLECRVGSLQDLFPGNCAHFVKERNQQTPGGAIVSWGHHRLQDYRQTLPFLEIERRISPPGGESHHRGVKLTTEG